MIAGLPALGAPALLLLVLLGLFLVSRGRRLLGAAAHGRLPADGTMDGGAPARRAVCRWAWRLFKREWRQQLLVLSLIVVAVGATVVGSAVAIDSVVPADAGFGTATDMATFTTAGPQMTNELAMIEARYGRTDVIENASRPIPGSVGSYQLRAQRPKGPFGRPMLSLLSGHYPTAAGQTALTPSLASELGLKVGDTWPQGGGEPPLRVVGLVQDPENFEDQFALVAPGQVSAPSEVTVLFDAPGVLPQQIGPNVQTPATAAQSNPLPVIVVGGGLTMGMMLIGLVSVGGFTVLAQRRLRSFGVLASLGATERNISLVVKANGAVVGLVGAVLGAGLGLLAWAAYRPTFEATAHRSISLLAVPWPAVAGGMALAILATYFSASRPARAVARVPVLAALSGRPNPPPRAHRSALPGVVCLMAAFLLLGYGGSQTSWGHGGGAPEVVLGMGLLVPAVVLLAPFFLALLGKAGRLAPVTVRLAWRDLARHRARSGPALAAISLGVLIAVVICVVAGARYANPLDYTGPNVASNQLMVYTQGGFDGAAVTSSPPTVKKTASQIAGIIGANEVVELLTTSATLTHSGEGWNWNGPIYVATPQLLAAFHVGASEVSAKADVLSMRPALTSVTGVHLVVQAPVVASGPPVCTRGPCGAPPGPFGRRPVGLIKRPVIEEVSSLPSGTDAPNTLITMHAVRQLGLRTTVAGWFLEAPRTLDPAQLKSAQLVAGAHGMSIETRDNVPSMTTLVNGATAFGIGLALAILAMSVGLVRSETAGDLRVLAATGASSWARHALSAATAGGLALLGALLGTVAGYVGIIGWVRSSTLTGGLSFLENVPVTNLLLILVGMPAIAVALGWALSGRERPATVRRAVE